MSYIFLVISTSIVCIDKITAKFKFIKKVINFAKIYAKSSGQMPRFLPLWTPMLGS